MRRYPVRARLPRRPTESDINRTLAFAVPFVLALSIGLGVAWWTAPGAVPRGEPVPTDVGDLHLEQPFVRVKGMAHYPVVIRQKVPPTFPWQEEKTYFLFPLFPEYETTDRAVRVLVRTEREPERFVAYEYMTLEGHLALPVQEKVPYSTEIELGKRSDYFFTDELMLLEPWRIESDGEVWEAPE